MTKTRCLEYVFVEEEEKIGPSGKSKGSFWRGCGCNRRKEMSCLFR